MWAKLGHLVLYICYNLPNPNIAALAAHSSVQRSAAMATSGWLPDWVTGYGAASFLAPATRTPGAPTPDAGWLPEWAAPAVTAAALATAAAVVAATACRLAPCRLALCRLAFCLNH
jgi:hypothetical protein